MQGAILLQRQPLSDKSLLRGSRFLCTSSIDPIRCNPGANLLLGLPRRLAGHPRHCKYPSRQNWLQRAVKRATILQICSYMCSAVLSPHRGPGPAVLFEEVSCCQRRQLVETRCCALPSLIPPLPLSSLLSCNSSKGAYRWTSGYRPSTDQLTSALLSAFLSRFSRNSQDFLGHLPCPLLWPTFLACAVRPTPPQNRLKGITCLWATTSSK